MSKTEKTRNDNNGGALFCPEDFLGKEVIVSTYGKVYSSGKSEKVQRTFVGKLDIIRETSLSLDPWYEVLSVKDGKVTGSKDSDRKYVKYLSHSGSQKEIVSMYPMVWEGGPEEYFGSDGCSNKNGKPTPGSKKSQAYGGYNRYSEGW